jgi:PKD repeat protein
VSSASSSGRRPTAIVLGFALALVAASSARFGAAAPSTPPDGWRIRLEASLPGLVDKARLTFGAGTGAIDGLDDFDDPHPPAFPSRFLDLVALHTQDEPGWEAQPLPTVRYRAQFGAPLGSADRVIPFVLQTDQAGPLTLTWALLTDVDLARHFAVLRDLESGTTVDMWEQFSYTFTPVTPSHRFQLELTNGRSAPSPPSADFSYAVSPGLVVAFTDTSTDVDEDITEWSWSFGDGATSTAQNPSHTYAAKGSYAVTLTVMDATERANSVTQSVYVASPPSASFTYLPPAPVNGSEVLFIDTSTDVDGTVVGWSWTFSDGGTSIARHPRHTYPASGTFTVSLTVTDDDGSTATTSGSVVIGVANPATAPNALFRPDVPAKDVAALANGGAVVASSGTCCGGHEPFQMLDDVVGLPWATAGVTGHFATIQVSSGAPRVIDSVQVQPRSDCCADQRVKNFAVDVSTTGFAAADFTQVLSATAANDGLLQTFALPAGTSAKYVRYRPLNAQSSPNNISTSKFKVLSTASGPRTVTFQNQSTNAVSYEWTFGDGGTSTDATPTYTYAAVGAYTVTLRARSADGRTSTISRLYEARGPTVSFEVAPEAPVPDDAATFTSTSLFPSAPGKTWAWSFGDGGTSTAANALHTYALPGTYTVTLTATDAEGFSDTATRTITVADDPAAPPRAFFNPRSRGKNVALLEAGARVHSSSGQWSTGFPTTTAIDADPSNSYWATPNATPTNGWIKIDLAGTRAWTIDRVKIQGDASTERVKDFKVLVSTSGTADADFTEVLSAQNPNNTVLTEHLFPAPVSARYVMVRMLNNWGHSCCIGIQQLRVLTGPETVGGRNLALSETGATIHSYATQYATSHPATTLIDAATNNSYWASQNGTTSNWIKIDLAGTAARQLDFIRLTPQLSDQRVRDYQLLVSETGTDDADFTLIHAGTAANMDGPTDVLLQNPRKAKYVMLRLLNNRGSGCCVGALQFKAFTGQEDGRTVRFENLSRGATSYAWDFGDGGTSTEAEPTHTFPGPGTYTVTLTATNANGATTITLEQVVRAAAISYLPAEPEAQSQIDFRDASPPELGLSAWAWTLGDGTTSIFQNPVKTYPTAGTYTVTMTGTDYEGNAHVATESVTLAAPAFRAMFNPRGGLNVASLENGAAVVAFSSQYDCCSWDAPKLLDFSTSTAWHSSNSPPVNTKWMKFSLAGGQTWQIDRFLLLGRQDCCFDQHPRDFEIAVSTSGTADADFKTVLRATMPGSQTTPQVFALPRPVLARYVLYRAWNSHGSTVVTTAALRAASGQVNSPTVVFDNLTVGGVAPFTYAWSFGDGGTSSEPSPTHTFPGPGSYDVTLTVTDATETTSSYTLRQRILSTPVATFTNAPLEPNESQLATFTDTTPSPAGQTIAERRWAWADGTANTVATAAATTHAFADNATYIVSLQVTDTWGQTASASRPVVVRNVAPTANAGPDWRWREDRALLVTPTIADVAGSRDPLTCSWSFGDGSPDAPVCAFNHTYPDTGTYTATLTVNDGDGGSVTDSFNVEVIERELPSGGGGGSGSGGGTGVGQTSKDYTYTLDADFELGTLLNVNHDAPGNDQLQLNKQAKPFPFVYIANSGRGTAVRIDVDTGLILGEYRTAPQNRAQNPSRTTVDKLGNVWVTNRDEAETRTIGGLNTQWGSTTRIGLIVGGTRSNADGTPNPLGEYLKAPFEYNTCVDKNGDGLIRTSRGLGNILAWPNTSGVDHDGGVETAVDECIQFYVRVRGTNTRTVAIDAQNDAWIGGANNWHEEVDGETGQRVTGTAFSLGCGGYGGLIDGNGILWSARFGNGLLRYNTITKTGVCFGNGHGDYGLGVDPVAGHIWHTTLSGSRVVKLNPATTTTANLEIARYAHGNSDAQGVAVDSKGNVWVSHALFSATTIGRVRTDGLFLGTSFLGPGSSGPTGVAVDANGKVWAANYNTSNVSRIDPEIGQKIAGTVPSGWYDLSVSLGAGASPYNYSDMTGAVAIGAASPSGFWSIKQDATAPGTIWKKISWDGSTPGGTSITVEVRAADTQTALPSIPFVAVGDGVPLSGIVGRFIEVRATLQTTDPTATPILTDIRISANTPPLASNLSVETNRDTAATIELPATDPEGDALTYEIVATPTNGSVSLAGKVATYTPNSRYVGPDSFTFKARDADAESNVATISITVLQTNDPPVAADLAVTTPEDTPLPIALPASDPDGDALTLAYTQPAHGSYDGTTYTPAPNYHGPDSFTYTATDPDSETDGGTISITVTPANDAPTAAGQSLTTPEDVALPLTLTGGDIDGDALVFAVVAGPAHGTLTGTAPALVYTPAADYHGPDAFTFTASDGQATSNLATVAITVTPVNDAPTAANQALSTPEDTALPLTLGGGDVDGDALEFAVVAGPAHGTLSGTAPALVYTPAADYHGPDAFTFTASDGQASSNVATVAITVTPVNDAPTAADQALSTPEDTPLPLTLSGGDIDGDALTYTVVTPPSHGTLTGTGASLVYTPAAHYHGGDSFTFRANDGTVESNVATVAITVTPVNDPPQANDQALSTPEDTPVPVTLTGSDVDGDLLTFTVVSGPSHGQLTGAAPGLTYTPAPNFNGSDSFTFKAGDGTADSNVATVTITVTPVDDPPVANNQSLTTPEDTPLPVTLTADEVDGDPLTFVVVTGPAHGTLSGAAPNLVYTPAPNYHGPDSVVFRVNDGHSDSNLATVAITVTPVNDPPVCEAAQIDGPQLWPPNHVMAQLQVRGVDDVDDDPVTVQATSVFQDEPVNAQADGDTSPDATLSPLQVRSEKSGQGDGRVYHIRFRGTDGQGGTCTGTVQVCVPHDQSPTVTCGDGGPLYDSTQP